MGSMKTDQRGCFGFPKRRALTGSVRTETGMDNVVVLAYLEVSSEDPLHGPGVCVTTVSHSVHFHEKTCFATCEDHYLWA